MRITSVIVLLVVAGTHANQSQAQDLAAEVAELRGLLSEVQQDYEARISELEARLARAEQIAKSASRDATEAFDIAEQTAIEQSSGQTGENTFNPALGAVVSGRFADFDTGWDEIPGFQPAGEIGTGESGFALGEAEINMKANVDDRFFGNLTFAIADEEGEVEVELEEAWLQTTGLPAGITVTGGRFFSAAGYINEFHRHVDDFADRPLPYQAFYGGQYKVDGLRARWLAPTPLLLEFGTELNWGSGFPAGEPGGSSPGTVTLFANLGGDVGASHSWQFGLSYIDADVDERSGGHGDEEPAETFSGDSELTIADFVWKWAPDGNPAQRNFKLQGEYFSRSESGEFDGIDYDGDQSGWYLQGVWQFMPRWRVGLRHDSVTADNNGLLAGTELEDPAGSSKRDSVMIDWSPSEFSRLRLQYTNDRVLTDSDQQWFLQYIMSIGAHGAHQF
jgi:hypothetical protein